MQTVVDQSKSGLTCSAPLMGQSCNERQIPSPCGNCRAFSAMQAKPSAVPSAETGNVTGLPLSLFVRPTKHPYGMLRGMTHAHEAEQTLAYMLAQCVKAGEWVSVSLNGNPWELVEAGLLVKDGEAVALTEKAKGLLYSHYGAALVEGRQ